MRTSLHVTRVMIVLRRGRPLLVRGLDFASERIGQVRDELSGG